MRQILLLFIFSITVCQSGYTQVEQTARYELEKKNTDDYFTVLSAGQEGVVLFRDTDNYNKGEGDAWQIVALDTALQEKWEVNMSIDIDYVFKAYEISYGRLYLLFRTAEYIKSDYHLIVVDIADGSLKRYDIPNEIEMYPTHMIAFEDRLILGAYVKNAPALFSFVFEEGKIDVIKGFFKDKTELVDLKDNENGSFNTLSLDKDYSGFFLKFRTYSHEGDILFERDVKMEDKYRLLGAKSTSFVDGNIAITGTYSTNASYLSQGIYFVIVKPEGQKNIVKYYDFGDFEHFFDYLKPSRAEKIQRKIKEKNAVGKEFKYSSRINIHGVQASGSGYIFAAEIYNPQYNNSSSRYLYHNPYNTSANSFGNSGRANYNYVKQTSRFNNLEEASSFKYLESLVVKLDKNGKLKWDNSIKIDDLESSSLENIVDYNESDGMMNMIYLDEEQITFKTFNKNAVSEQEKVDLKLQFDNDEIRHTFKGVGGAVHWYDNNFFVWGYHKVENKANRGVEPKRNVLYINKVEFK